jgi:hypothetical protein
LVLVFKIKLHFNFKYIDLKLAVNYRLTLGSKVVFFKSPSKIPILVLKSSLGLVLIPNLVFNLLLKFILVLGGYLICVVLGAKGLRFMA